MGSFVSLKSSEWIINSAKITIQNNLPDLLVVYLPHLDYASQKFGPDSDEFKKSVYELDDLIGNFLDFLNLEFPNTYEILLLSEYSFNQVRQSISPNYHPGEYIRVTVENNAKDTDYEITGIRLYFHTQPFEGQKTSVVSV